MEACNGLSVEIRYLSSVEWHVEPHIRVFKISVVSQHPTTNFHFSLLCLCVNHLVAAALLFALNILTLVYILYFSLVILFLYE